MNDFETILYTLGQSYALYALAAAVLVALCASLLGVTLVLKRFSFIGDGLSHVSFGSMAVAAVIGLTPANNMLIALPITVGAAVLLLAFGRNKKINGDAALALFSVSALAVGYLLFNLPPLFEGGGAAGGGDGNPGGGFAGSGNTAGDVCNVLFGALNIMTLTRADVLLCAGMTALVVPVFIVFYNKIFAVTFDETFAKATGTKTNLYNLIIAVVIAVIIVIAMKLVGALLISALVIFPAISAMRLFKSFRSVIICSAVVAVSCAALGVLLSVVFNTPVGATIVATNLLVFGIFSAFRLVAKRVAG